MTQVLTYAPCMVTDIFTFNRHLWRLIGILANVIKELQFVTCMTHRVSFQGLHGKAWQTPRLGLKIVVDNAPCGMVWRRYAKASQTTTTRDLPLHLYLWRTSGRTTALADVLLLRRNWFTLPS